MHYLSDFGQHIREAATVKMFSFILQESEVKHLPMTAA